MTLLEKQQLFMRLLPRLIDRAHELGYELKIGEGLRSQATADYYASIGKGISNSLHRLQLAIDLDLFHGNEYLTKTEDHAPLGSFWESLHPLCSWGGRFKDGNHYSIMHGGVR